jgi:hypothetical protein
VIHLSRRHDSIWKQRNRPHQTTATTNGTLAKAGPNPTERHTERQVGTHQRRQLSPLRLGIFNIRTNRRRSCWQPSPILKRLDGRQATGSNERTVPPHQAKGKATVTPR